MVYENFLTVSLDLSLKNSKVFSTIAILRWIPHLSSILWGLGVGLGSCPVGLMDLPACGVLNSQFWQLFIE